MTGTDREHDGLVPEGRGSDALDVRPADDGRDRASSGESPAEPVPAGRGGADSGSADLVEVEGETAGPPDAGSLDDTPGVGPRGADHGAVQTGPREDVHDASRGDRIRGIVAQTQGDVALQGLGEADARRALVRRLADAGIDVDADDLEALAAEVVSDGPPVAVDEAQPGASA